MNFNAYIVQTATIWTLLTICVCNSETGETPSSQKYRIDGKVSVPFASDTEWITNTRILVDGGEYLGFLKYDYLFQNGVFVNLSLLQISLSFLRPYTVRRVS